MGFKLAREILRKKPGKSARVLALSGKLGSGKTTFVQGFFRGLGLKARVMSPTFIIMRRTAFRNEKYKNVFHIDVYRIKSSKELLPLKLNEVMKSPENIVLVEWAEKVRKILPKGSRWLEFGYTKQNNERVIKLL